MPGRRRITHAIPPEAAIRRSVPWRDLGSLTYAEVGKELVVPLPWLAASLVAAHYAWYVVALPCSFMFFLTGLREVHGAFHYSLGISRRATELCCC